MAFDNTNILLRIKEVQDVYQANKQEGVTTMFVYRKYIYPRFLISRSTFYSYLSVPASKLLKEKNVEEPEMFK
jgi:hypothetical protein